MNITIFFEESSIISDLKLLKDYFLELESYHQQEPLKCRNNVYYVGKTKVSQNSTAHSLYSYRLPDTSSHNMS